VGGLCNDDGEYIEESHELTFEIANGLFAVLKENDSQKNKDKLCS